MARLHPCLHALLTAGIAAACVVFARVTAADQSARPNDILDRASAYVARYMDELSSVVAEERYVQVAKSTGMRVGSPPLGYDTSGVTPSVQPPPSAEDTNIVRRELRSEFLFVRTNGNEPWLPFRDVYQVNGEQLRDRDERLTRLLLDTSASAMARAKAINYESTRFNLGEVQRTVNLPLYALRFVDRANRDRFVFGLGSQKPVNGRPAIEITCRERQRPTLIQSNGKDLPIRGSVWVSPDDGRVLRTLMKTDDKQLRTSIEVTYALDTKLGILTPLEMIERYDWKGLSIDATASYSNYRRFAITVDEKLRQ